MLRYVTLSAHWQAESYDGADTYAASDLDYAPTANPLVWVANGKHANYRSQAVCDAGAFYYDTCDHPGARLPLEVLLSANLGESNHNILNGVGSRIGAAGFEWYWDVTKPFLGWFPRSQGGDTTPYAQSLIFFGF